MTGEITLRGKVLPIGGVKEKILAAHRAGVSTIILPRKNEKDLSEIPAKIKKDLIVRLVDSMDEVLPIALNRPIVVEKKWKRLQQAQITKGTFTAALKCQFDLLFTLVVLSSVSSYRIEGTPGCLSWPIMWVSLR